MNKYILYEDIKQDRNVNYDKPKRPEWPIGPERIEESDVSESKHIGRCSHKKTYTAKICKDCCARVK